jgi:hypothetical protein
LLFRPANPGALVTLKKTETGGSERYDETWFEGTPFSLPTPYVLTLSSHERTRPPITLVLYDNAGEHHLPSNARDSAQATGHLRRSAASIVLIDPIQHSELRKACSDADPQVAMANTLSGTPPRQELLVSQAAASIRKMRNLREEEAIDQPLIVAVGKADAWAGAHLADIDEQSMFIRDDEGQLHIDHEALSSVSASVRAFLENHAPEITGTVDALCNNVLYLPVSATGTAPELGSDDERGMGFRAGNITPSWTMECLLAAVELSDPGCLFPEEQPVPPGEPGP